MVTSLVCLYFLSADEMVDLPDSSPRNLNLPVREDCWSEEATATLIDAWGRRYVDLNRGNLRQKDWQDVADIVNALHGHTKKTHRTDVQCKNRIDTIKKKYKMEKARLSNNASLPSSWLFYDRLHSLIGSTVSVNKPSPSRPLPFKKMPTPPDDDGYFRRHFSAQAAAAAAEEESEDEERESEEEEREGEGEGMRNLARAIERFVEVYERVEGEKLSQMVELEKQRMQFAKDLEVQRMQMFMDTQVQLERIKRGK